MPKKMKLVLHFAGKEHEFPILEGDNEGVIEKMGEIVGNNPPCIFAIEIKDDEDRKVKKQEFSVRPIAEYPDLVKEIRVNYKGNIGAYMIMCALEFLQTAQMHNFNFTKPSYVSE